MRKISIVAIVLFQTANHSLAQAAAQPSLESGLGQMLVGLGGVLAVLLGSLWLLKKLTGSRGQASGLMRVIAATAVGGRERVVIVEVGSTWLVLGVAPGRVCALAEIPRQSIEPTPASTAPAMTMQWLQQILRNR